jgi:outer membrane receptor protein involved in Fe transport
MSGLRQRRRSRYAAVMTGSLLLAALLAAAPTEAPAADEIVVTGRGLDQATGEQVYDVVRIDRDRLTGSASNRLEDVLRDVPGFQNFRRSDARSANPTSQGATLRAIGGNASSRALLVLDGVPQSDPFGGWVFWPAYDPRRLGLVRIVRGGGSGANGPGALAGTIEMSSVGPADLTGTVAEVAYGSRDSIDAFAGFGAELGAGYAMASASYLRGDGFVPVIEEQRGSVDRPAPYEQASAAVRAVAPLSSDIELQANGLWFSDRRERGTAFSGIATTGLDTSVRLVGRGDWQWSALAYVQKREFANSFATVTAGRSAVARVSEQYNVPSTGTGARVEVRPPLGDAIELRIGGDWRRTTGETKERSNFVAGVGTRGRRAGGETETVGGFAEAAWTGGPFTLTAGGRIDHWRIRDGFQLDRIFATGAETLISHPDRAGWEQTARGGIAWRPTDALTLRSAAYIGWRLPTLNELYRPFRVGADATAANAALDPERLKGIEAGIDLRPADGARLGLTLFANRLKDAIANVTLGQGPGVFPGVGFVGAGGAFSQRQNLDAIVARGVELDGGYSHGQWSLSGGVVFVDAEVRAEGAAAPLDGMRPAQTPNTMASLTFTWEDPGGASASLTGRYVGNQFEDDLETQRLPDALTFDAVAALPITRRLRVEARAENLTNKRVIAGISGAGIVERATPRTLWIGLSLAN